MTDVGEAAKRIRTEVNLANDQLHNYVHKKVRPRVSFGDRPIVIQLAKDRTKLHLSDGQQSRSDQSPRSTTEEDTPVRVKDRIKRAQTKVASGVPPSKIQKPAGLSNSPESPVLFTRKIRVTQSQERDLSLQPG